MEPYLKRSTVFGKFKNVYPDDSNWDNKVDLSSDVCYVESISC
ncbi:hypothetical protein [Treponema sp.]|nr:hypothetical protein [Treponema sp.]